MIILKNTIYSRVNQAGGGGGFSNTKSLLFDGVDEYVDLGTSTTLEFTNDFSVSVWIKDTASLNRGIVCCGNRSGTSGWMIYRTSANKVAFSLYTANNRIATSTTSINTGAWFNVIGTFEKNGTANQQVKIYVNGSLEGQNGWFSPQTPAYPGTIYKQIAFPYAGANEFLGNIDEVAAFNYLLSTDEINTVSTAPSDLSSLNPVAWYRMGDNSTYQTPQILMPEYTNKDKISNYSLSFDGVDDYVGIGSTSLGITSAITVSAWVKIPTTNTGGGGANIQIIASEDATGGTNRNWNLYWRHLSVSNKNFYFLVYHTNGSATTVQSTGIVPNDGNWHHLMGTFDGTTDANGLKLYVDGTLFQTTAGSTGIRSTSGVAPSIGANETGSTWRLEGNIDEVAVWNSVQDVNSIYNGGEPTTISGALAHWKLGEQATFSTNWTVPDQVGSNDGTSANMTVEDRIGDAPNSTTNAVSFNMEEADIDNDTP